MANFVTNAIFLFKNTKFIKLCQNKDAPFVGKPKKHPGQVPDFAQIAVLFALLVQVDVHISARNVKKGHSKSKSMGNT